MTTPFFRCLNRPGVLLLMFFITQTIHAQKTGSWGDQGNGTYKNPILEANYPDNDIIRVKDSYYMMSSTNHFVPGMVILKSKDLVNWQFSNNIIQSPVTFSDLFNLGPSLALVSRGTWAGSFGYNGQYYFAYWCFNKLGRKDGTCCIMYAKAASIEGPWSVPEELTWPNGKSINTTDPGVLWDIEKKEAWLCVTIGGKVQIYPLAWDGKSVLANADAGIVVTSELEGESNKLYKFDDRYFVMNSHVGKNHDSLVRMEAFHRAKDMRGPWEGRLVLENGNGTNRHPSQGTLLKLDDNSWWYMHQLARGNPQERYMGRPQFLEPVTWKDGWPLIGTDTDGDGIGEVIWEHKKPIAGFPVTAPATDDDFTKPVLGLQWNWRFNPKASRWSLTERPGYLRLKACAPAVAESAAESLQFVPNIIGQRLMGRYKNVMTTKMELQGMAAGQEAGFHISAGDNNVIGVKKNNDETLNVFFKHVGGAKDTLVLQTGPVVNQNAIWFQAKVVDGLANFFYSFDGKTFLPFGQQVRLLFSGFTPNMVGFYSMNNVETGYVDIDWFTYDYDGPKGKK